MTYCIDQDVERGDTVEFTFTGVIEIRTDGGPEGNPEVSTQTEERTLEGTIERLEYDGPKGTTSPVAMDVMTPDGPFHISLQEMVVQPADNHHPDATATLDSFHHC